MTISSVKWRKVDKLDNTSNRLVAKVSVRRRSLLSILRDILSLPYISLSHQKRVIRWELPRLLSSIERLDLLVRRSKAISSSVSGGVRDSRITEVRARELDNEMLNLVQSADRIKSLLGYKD